MNNYDDTPLDGTSDSDIMDDAKLRFKQCQDWEAAYRPMFKADVRFAEGDSRNNNHWSDTSYTNRTAANQPCLTINIVRQHLLQVTNAARQNKAGIEVRAVGDGATYQAAKVYEGLCRHIEYSSNAQAAYDTATYFQVYGGIGYVRVVTDYADADSFDLDLFIRRIPDPMTVYIDPSIQHFDGSDAKFAFVFTDMERRLFAKEYPHLADMGGEVALNNDHDWVTTDHIRVAEYYRMVERPDYLTQMPDGTRVRDSEQPAGHAAAAKALGLRRRKVSRTVIEHIKIAGEEIISRTTWPGRYIPIARCVGEETIIDGKLDRKGHTRCMISAQQMANYFYSAAVEHVALQGKTPYLGQAEAFEGFEEQYNNANVINYAYLPFKGYDDQGRPVQRPQRAEPPQMAPGLIQGLNISSQLVKDVSGQHQATLGEPSNEKSGVAIQQRQRQGENATAHYLNHADGMIMHVGRILIDVIPQVYDTARVLQILNQDDTQQRVEVNPDAEAGHEQVQDPEAPDYDPSAIAAIFNPKIGKFAVVADTGPSFATKRQDAFNAFNQLAQADKDFMKIAGDLMFKNADFPGADDLAQRYHRTIPQNLLSDKGPPPEVQHLQQQLQAVTQHGQQLLGQADQEMADLKRQIAALQDAAKDKEARTVTADYDAETRRLQAITAADPGVAQVLARSLLSGLLNMPALPVLQAHAEDDALHAQALSAGPPGAMGGPMGMPDPEPAAGADASEPAGAPEPAGDVE